MKKTFWLSTSTALFMGTMAMADAFTDQIVNDLQSKGFDRIEIKVGPNQTKAEASNGTQKVEVVYDNATGAIVKQETERAREDGLRTGVEISTRNEDFTGEDDSRSRDRSSDDSADDDNEDDNRGGGSDDDSNDDSADDHGNDGSDDDHGDDRGGSDDGDDDRGGSDDGDDDHGGSDSGGDDHGGDDGKDD